MACAFSFPTFPCLKKSVMRKTLRFLGKGLAFVLLFVLFYFVIGVAGSLIPVNSSEPTGITEYKIFIQTNGVHTDIVVPVKSEIMDWTKIVNFQHSISGSDDFTYAAFGWGDLEFYQKTPEWSDLTPKIALKALFLKSPSALHVKFENDVSENENTISIKMSKLQFQKLSNYIKNSFDFDENGNPQPIPNLHYSTDDAFYKAKGSLNLFYTCNTWTNNALKTSGLEACLWTPFVEGIFNRYP